MTITNWKPLTEREPTFTPDPARIDVTDATRPSIAAVDMARARTRKHQEMLARLDRERELQRQLYAGPDDDGPAAA